MPWHQRNHQRFTGVNQRPWNPCISIWEGPQPLFIFCRWLGWCSSSLCCGARHGVNLQSGLCVGALNTLSRTAVFALTKMWETEEKIFYTTLQLWLNSPLRTQPLTLVVLVFLLALRELSVSCVCIPLAQAPGTPTVPFLQILQDSEGLYLWIPCHRGQTWTPGHNIAMPDGC